MIPSRRRVQVLKATKLAKVSKVWDEEEEPQGDSRGKDGQGDNLKGSNDDKMCTRSIEEGGSWPVLCSSQMDSLGTSCQFNSPYIYNVCLYICNLINKLSVSIWSMHMVCALPCGPMTSLHSKWCDQTLMVLIPCGPCAALRQMMRFCSKWHDRAPMVQSPLKGWPRPWLVTSHTFQIPCDQSCGKFRVRGSHGRTCEFPWSYDNLSGLSGHARYPMITW